MKTTVNTLVRLSIAALFVISGYSKLTIFEPVSILAGEWTFGLAGVIELGGGIWLLLGYRVKPVLALLLTLSAWSFGATMVAEGIDWPANAAVAIFNIAIVILLAMLLANGAGKPVSLPSSSEAEDFPIYNVKL